VPGQGRLGDKANVSADAHGCPGCPHPGTGPAISGSPDVLVNGRPALRLDDIGIHAVCCGPNMWQAQRGAPTVFINGRAAFRVNDPTKHCGGSGQLIEGSADVLVGDAGGAGTSGGSNGAGGRGAGGRGAGDAASGTHLAGGGDAAQVAARPTDWIEIVLVDDGGAPLQGHRVRVRPASGAPVECTTDARGVARVESIAGGSVRVAFPDLDQSAWKPV
jgi:uncharacterized Zn-binding protein involved in type VI secretion